MTKEDQQIIADAMTTVAETYTTLRAMTVKLDGIVEAAFIYKGGQPDKLRKAAINCQRRIQDSVLASGWLGGVLAARHAEATDDE